MLEVTPQAITAWKREGCPTEDGRRFRLAEVVRWLRDRDRETWENSLSAGDSRERWEAARALKTEHEAEQAGLELAHRRGELVEVERFEVTLARAFGRVRSRLLALPSRAAGDMVGQTDEIKAERVLDRYVLEILQELRNEAVPDDEDATSGASNDD